LRGGWWVRGAGHEGFQGGDVGRPICSVSSFASSSWRSFRIWRAFLTIFWRSLRVVLRNLRKAAWARFGMAVSSSSVGPVRERMGWLVVGEMVVIFSGAMVVFVRGLMGVVTTLYGCDRLACEWHKI
jgi:hypothetical protein